jgi:hypothetical protein
MRSVPASEKQFPIIHSGLWLGLHWLLMVAYPAAVTPFSASLALLRNSDSRDLGPPEEN